MSHLRGRLIPVLVVLVWPCFVSGQVIDADRPEPRPAPAIEFVLAAFDKYDVVAIAESHGNATEHRFLQALISHPELPKRVNDIVIEFGNSLYQETLDRYILGADVPFEELCLVWRNTPASPLQTWDSPVYFEFLKTVREINRDLRKKRKIRVWASERPIDWSKIESPAEHRPFLERSEYPAMITRDRVLAHGRKALLIRGGVHLAKKSIHGGQRLNVARFLTERYGKKLISIELWHDLDGQMPEVERRLARWPTPSIALLEGTWLGELPAGPLFHVFVRRDDGTWGRPEIDYTIAEIYDAFLYLGPSSEMEIVRADPELITPEYRAELERRKRLLHRGRGADQ